MRILRIVVCSSQETDSRKESIKYRMGRNLSFPLVFPSPISLLWEGLGTDFISSSSSFLILYCWLRPLQIVCSWVIVIKWAPHNSCPSDSFPEPASSYHITIHPLPLPPSPECIFAFPLLQGFISFIKWFDEGLLNHLQLREVWDLAADNPRRALMEPPPPQALIWLGTEKRFVISIIRWN